MILPVVLCGGSGSRLWPLSRQSFPKQFVPLIGDRSLLQLTLERVAGLLPRSGGHVCCVSSEDHRFLVQDAGLQAGVQVQQILEPVPRNTAAAMALAAVAAPSDALLLFCPADHHIPDAAAFAHMVHAAVPAALAGRMVTFGVIPSYPSTGYGYIEKGPADGVGGHTVARFVEKPDAAKAAQFLATGRYLWNAGIFLVQASTLLKALERHAPDILARCREAMASSNTDGSFTRPNAPIFSDCRSQSIDYAVMEQASNVSVFPFQGQWSDVGSWLAVSELTPPDSTGNRIDGHGLAVNSQRTYIHAPQRTVVSLGTRDLMIIDTPDALLVAASECVEQVKDVVAQLEAKQQPQATAHRKVARPWGWYDSIDAGPTFQVKRLHIKPGASISLQLHRHRAEHWVVVAGVAQVTLGEEVFRLAPGQSTYIAAGTVHRLENPGTTHLEMIEVQSGSYLGEDDIIRMQDNYGRAVGKAT